MSFGYEIRRILRRIHRDSNEYMNDYFRSKGCRIGSDVHIFTNIATSEASLISIGDNTTIASNVQLLTHDASPGVVFGRDVYSDICGKISIGSKCFIGAGAIILCGVTIPDNTIVAAGSVVTKSVPEEGKIIGGNPARVIGTVEEYKRKNAKYFLSLSGLDSSQRMEVIRRGNLIDR